MYAGIYNAALASFSCCLEVFVVGSFAAALYKQDSKNAGCTDGQADVPIC